MNANQRYRDAKFGNKHDDGYETPWSEFYEKEMGNRNDEFTAF